MAWRLRTSPKSFIASPTSTHESRLNLFFYDDDDDTIRGSCWLLIMPIVCPVPVIVVYKLDGNWWLRVRSQRMNSHTAGLVLDNLFLYEIFIAFAGFSCSKMTYGTRLIRQTKLIEEVDWEIIASSMVCRGNHLSVCVCLLFYIFTLVIFFTAWLFILWY